MPTTTTFFKAALAGALALTSAAAASARKDATRTTADSGATSAAPERGSAAPNTLTPAEKAAGWKLLFDGRRTDGWRGYRQASFPEKGWEVVDGCLRVTAGGGDLVTTEEFGDFELVFEWKASPKANSGVMYRVTEAHPAPWQSGPEFQILDDAGHGVSPTDHHSAGAAYELAAPAAGKALRPAGEWNQGRIILDDGRLRHYVNGVKVVDVRIDGDDWKERIAKSKFREYEGFGMAPKGRIALQDHGDEVWFRNLKLRDPDAPMPGEMALFNGRDLSGWECFLQDGAQLEDVWSVQDGVLVCKGQPIGYLKTARPFENGVLKLEWRWPQDKAPGNSGVLIRKVGEDKIWPKSVEAQLMSGSAGDFFNIGEFVMSTDPARLSGRHTPRTHSNENPVGEWNEYEIVFDGGDVVLFVNGEELNRAWDVESVAGPICLQSEGAEIHFRNVRLAPIVEEGRRGGR